MLYSKLGPYYDLLGWADFTYRLWPHVRDFFGSIGSRPSRFLDIGCGTGVLAALLSDINVRVTGVDICAEMIEVARSKEYKLKPNFIVTDMRDFDLGETFPVTGCFYDTLNHLLSEDDVQRAFTCACRHTEQGGHYLFDINTALGLRNWNPFYSSMKGSFYATQHGRYDHGTRSGTYKIEAFVKREDGTVEFIDETVREQAYSRKFIRQALAKAGFSRLVFMPFDRSEPVAESERLFVISKK
jgi:SAM-dependent methyltransferase